MATRLEIQLSNGAVTITVGGSASGDGNAGGTGQTSVTTSGGNGKSAPTQSGGNGKSSQTASGGDGSGSGCCCAPVVIGPIVVSGGMLTSGSENSGGTGQTSSTMSGGNGKSAPTQSGGNGKSSQTASGGGAPGDACCAPLVIGPIVITDCCGQSGSSGDPSSDECSTAVSVNPPAKVITAGRNLGAFHMQPQQETYWCWAAVAVSINAFFNPALAGPAWTQETLATALMQQLGNVTANCAANPGGTACNQPEPLDMALTITQNLRTNGFLAGEHLTFESLQNWFTAQLPVAARIQWRGGGGHFIALDACKVTASGRQLVHVQDPNSATSSLGFWDYDALVEDYQEAGCWSDAYLVD